MLESDISANDRRVKRTMAGETDAIEINGPLDFNDTLVISLVQQILHEGKTTIALDLSKASYVSSPGIATIIKVIKKLQAVGGQLLITGATPDMANCFSTARIDRFMKFI
jgi:anti-anti-sigma factor